MQSNDVAILILAVGNLLQPLFWCWIARGLIDRVMSKNYPEFVQSQVYSKGAENKSKSQSLGDDLVNEAEEVAILHELNSMVPQ